MKVSRNWLEKYIDLQESDESLSEILTGLGLEVEGVERVESVKGGLRGVVTGKVLSCERHPDADKLSVTMVDIGADEPLQIVCGAPNVAQGQIVPVATVGTVLHFRDGESLEIKKAKIRGVHSEGMICAEDELGLGEGHDGIMVLPEGTPVGVAGAEYFHVEIDTIFDIGLTPNRSDATCHLGVARDLAAYLAFHSDDGSLRIQEPELDDLAGTGSLPKIEVSLEDQKACPRYSGVVIQGLKVGPSPEWLKRSLESIGLRSVNNVVDVTNYVLHEMGQPLHAFDMRELPDRKIIVKKLPGGTTFTTLDEQERTLHAEDLMICNGSGEPMCIGGVFGGAGSGVKDDTTAIFLESAHFEATGIRNTSMRHLLRTDAAKVFEKGSDPNITVMALKRAVKLLRELCGGAVASAVVDLYPEPISRKNVRLRHQKVRQLIGVDIPEAKVEKLLKVLDMNVLGKDKGEWQIDIPTNKSDVTREVDVIEELLRIYGFNQIPLGYDVRSTIAPQANEDQLLLREKLSAQLEGLGFSEMMGLVLTPSRFLTTEMHYKEEELVFINNTSNIHLDSMRPSLLVSALEAVRHNHNRQQHNLRLFEIGKEYAKVDGSFRENWRLDLAMTGRRFSESWINTGQEFLDFYSLKAVVQALLQKLGLNRWSTDEITDNPHYHYGLSYRLGKNELVRFGAVHPRLLKATDIKQELWHASFDLEQLLRITGKKEISFTPISKFPESRRDLAIVVDEKSQFSELEQLAQKAGGQLLKEIGLFDVYRHNEHIGPGKKSYALSFVFRDDEKTLSDKQVDKAMQLITNKLSEKLGAIVRQ